jgi:PAS domain S-box-containing protein
MSTKKQIEEELRLCQQRIVDIFEFLPTATFTLDLDKCVTSWNKALERMTGIPAAQMLGKGDYAYSIPFFGEAIPHLIDFLFRIDEDMTTRFPNVINEEGSLLTEVFCPALYNKRGAWISAKASPLLDQFGNIKGAIGSFHDISKRKLAESSLKESEEKFRAYIEKAPLAIFVVDAKGNYVDVNAEACKMTGYSREELLKITIAEFLAPESIGEGLKLFERVNKAGFAQGELIGCKKNSSKYNVDLVSVKIRNNCFLAFCVDITAKKRNMDQVLYLSYHDSLTGLYNRRFYEEELKRLDTRRNLPLSIIMGDVNGLKLINDSFGHETGDLLLKKAAEAIKKGCRADDIIARIGGDEFVILLPQTGSV